jgi:hypothetical protein
MRTQGAPIPFPFVLDELVSLRPTIKRVFGFTYLYLGERLLCALRDSKKQTGSNGIWLFTTTEYLESLGAEFPELSLPLAFRKKRVGNPSFEAGRI